MSPLCALVIPISNNIRLRQQLTIEMCQIIIFYWHIYIFFNSCVSAPHQNTPELSVTAARLGWHGRKESAQFAEWLLPT